MDLKTKKKIWRAVGITCAVLGAAAFIAGVVVTGGALAGVAVAGLGVATAMTVGGSLAILGAFGGGVGYGVAKFQRRMANIDSEIKRVRKAQEMAHEHISSAPKSAPSDKSETNTFAAIGPRSSDKPQLSGDREIEMQPIAKPSNAHPHYSTANIFDHVPPSPHHQWQQTSSSEQSVKPKQRSDITIGHDRKKTSQANASPDSGTNSEKTTHGNQNPKPDPKSEIPPSNHFKPGSSG